MSKKTKVKNKEIEVWPVKMVKVKDLIPNEINPRTITKERLARLQSKIERLGFNTPVKLDNDGNLLGGNKRYRMMFDAGYGELEIPAMIPPKKLTEKEKKEIIISDNVHEGDWDWDLLANSFDVNDLKEWGLEGLPAVHEIMNEGKCDEDELPEIVEPKTKLGDIYKLGNHRLMCGDSTSIDSVEKLMNGEKADMVFTDPPYGVSYQSNWRVASNKFDVIKNDETFLSEWINVLPAVSNGWVFVWTRWKVIGKWLEITAPIGQMTNMIIWDKGGGGIGDLEKTFSTDYEIALVFNRGAKITGKRIGSVWGVGKDGATEYVHPTQKPVELCQTALENCTEIKSQVLDLFGGSGSTLIACEKTNRNCFMMELDPHYCDVIVARWEKFTGKKAELLLQK